MNRENDTSQEPWEEPLEEDSYEGETRFRQDPRSSHDAYDDLTTQTRYAVTWQPIRNHH